MSRSIRFVLSLSLLLAAGVTPAAAEPATDSRRVAVRYADLDLSTASDIESLHERLRSASYKACRRHDDLLSQAAQIRACREATLAHAIATFGHRELAQRHAGGARQAS